jgi:hypothetical protein
MKALGIVGMKGHQKTRADRPGIEVRAWQSLPDPERDGEGFKRDDAGR